MYIKSLKNVHPLSPIIPFLRIDFIEIIINVMCKDVDLSIVYVKVGQIIGHKPNPTCHLFL